MVIPLNLTYKGSLKPDLATFYCLNSDSEPEPVEIVNRLANTPTSSFSEGYASDAKPVNTTAYKLGRRQLHPASYCNAPFNVSCFYCKFSLSILPNSLTHNTCDDLQVEKSLENLANLYSEQNGYLELAMRYAKNILRGKWLWNNIDISSQVSICVTESGDQIALVDNAQELTWSNGWEKHQDELFKMSKLIAESLSSKKRCRLIVIATIHNDCTKEVYPSQLVKTTNDDQDFSMTAVGGGKLTVCLEMDKVNAGIQSIDDWINCEEPLRVNEYGSDKDRHLALRTPDNKKDIYALLTKTDEYIKYLEREKLNEDETSNEIHYVMALLVKGGVFNRKSEKEKK